MSKTTVPTPPPKSKRKNNLHVWSCTGLHFPAPAHSSLFWACQICRQNSNTYHRICMGTITRPAGTCHHFHVPSGLHCAGPAHAGKTLHTYHRICRVTITRPAGLGHHFPVLSRSVLSRAGPRRQNSKYTSQDLQGDPENDITFHRRQVQPSKATFVYKPLDYHT